MITRPLYKYADSWQDRRMSGATDATNQLVSGTPVLEGSGAMFARCFTGTWVPVTRTTGYRVSLIGAALFLCLVPVVYVGLIAAIGVGVWKFYTGEFGVVLGAEGLHPFLSMFLVALPGLGGVVVALLMLRPIPRFFSEAPVESVLEISPSEEPRLFGFVEAVCATMGAPAPERISIDCSVNASAQLTSSAFAGRRRLTLHFGLPLVAGLTSTEFAGVLAHEFGHFSQGSGMRATSILMRLTYWMMIAAYERGGVDEWLSNWRSSKSFLLVVMALFAGLCVWMTRSLLQVVFFLAFGVARFMGRRMEFDADAHQARFVGSETAMATWPRIFALQEALEVADGKVGEQWRSKRLPEDFPALVASISRRLSPDVRARIRRTLETRTNGWLDSHPASGRRLDAMRELAEKGVFRLDAPATTLFTNFNDAAKRVSYGFFKRRVGEAIFSATFVKSSAIFGSSAEEESRHEVARGYLGFEPPEWRPLAIRSDALSFEIEPKACWEQVNAARARLQKAAPAARDAEEDFFSAERVIRNADAAEAAFGAGIGSIHARFDLSFRTEREMRRARERALEKATPAIRAMDEAIGAASLRIACTLRMLAFAGIERRVPDARRMSERAATLLCASEALRGSRPRANAVLEDFLSMVVLAPFVDDPKHRDRVREPFRLLSDRVREGVLGIRQDLGGIRSPYPGVDGEVSLGGLLSSETPAWREYEQILLAGNELVRKYAETQSRIGLELASIAAAADAALRKSGNASSAGPR
ncbi:MAG: M48 family metalloprotease [Planctomycetes bacterium]|nr:M48 family metalloprotease [Planctomycetota bacterium]